MSKTKEMTPLMRILDVLKNYSKPTIDPQSMRAMITALLPAEREFAKLMFEAGGEVQADAFDDEFQTMPLMEHPDFDTFYSKYEGE